MNTQVCSATGDTPYNIVFRTTLGLIDWHSRSLPKWVLVNEDDIPDDVLVEDFSEPEEGAQLIHNEWITNMMYYHQTLYCYIHNTITG